MRTLLAFLALWAGEAVPARAQEVPTGTPFSTTHFAAEAYHAQAQNWSIAQDARGLVYAANNDGILQYDGARWDLIETSEDVFVRSVASDAQGTVYAGAVNDFGMLRPDSTATLQYVSLAERLPSQEQDFGDVWYTHATDDYVYFQTRSRLFRWDGDRLHSWKSETEAFHTSFMVRGTLYVRESDRGLLRAEGDSLKIVPGGERFATMSVYAMVPHGENSILIGTSKENFFLHDGQTLEPFPTEVDTLLEETQLYHGCSLPAGEIALATLGKGVLIIDHEGQLVQTIDQQAGLPDGTVNKVYPDKQGGLWMALHNGGIFRAEVSSPLSRFGKGFGLEGIVYDLSEQGGALYAATGAGVYRLAERQARGGQSRPHFEKVLGVPATWDLLSYGGALYAATRQGVYRVQEDGGVLLSKDKTFSLASPADAAPGQLYVGTASGLGVLRKRNGAWTFDMLARTESEVRAITTGAGEALWFSTLDGSVFRFPPDGKQPQEEGMRVSLRPQRFGPGQGLPAGRGTIASFQGAPIFMSKEGLYRLRITRGDTTFYRDTTLTGGAAYVDSSRGPLRAFYETDAGNAWLFYDDRVEIAYQQADGQYARVAPAPLQFPRSDVVRARIDAQDGAWISNGEELIRYNDMRAQRLRESPRGVPTAMIRKVSDASTGEVIYGGAARHGGARSAKESIQVPYRQNSFRAAFALPRYGGDAPTLYQYRMKEEGEWSEWGQSAAAALGRFHEGNHTIQVRARSANAVPGAYSQASITLRVLPPWYRTVWAYLSYLGFGVLALLGARRYQRLRTERQEAREAARRHRRETEREREAREQLQKAHDRLEEANRLKENFLSNTSHELRTPLTSILGYAEVLRDDHLSSREQREFLGIIRSNGKRLLKTLDMLLEISQLRAGTLRPDPHPMEVSQQVEEAAESFRERAAAKGLTFRFTPASDPIQALLPAAHVRRVIENLVDNAVKFTEKGRVQVIVRDVADEKVRIDVCDTGVGMEQPEALFAEFRQGSEGVSRAYEGNGLGLTIAGRLARLMNGTIEVQSTKGEGSCFSLHLPRELDSSASSPPPDA